MAAMARHTSLMSSLLRQPLSPFLLPLRPLSSCLPLQGAVPTIGPKKRNRIPNRHWKPEFRKQRAWKVMKIDLPDYEWERRRARGELTPEEMKEKAKKMGVAPLSSYQERPVYISSVGALLDEYIPPEGEGKASLLSVSKGSETKDLMKSKGKTMLAMRKIRKYEEDFDPRDWVNEAMVVYMEAHKAMADGDEDRMHQFVTEKAFPEMMNMAKRKTIRWAFVKSLEEPKVVHARRGEIMGKDNEFAQLTVRMHSQQTLAVYDRFGRLIHGSEHVAKDVLEFVVFEKHISNTYGRWRLHAKILPDWLPAREPGRLTYKVPRETGQPEEQEVNQTEEQEQPDEGSMLDRFGRAIKGQK